MRSTSLICIDPDQTFCAFCFNSAGPENLTAVILTVIWHDKIKHLPSHNHATSTAGHVLRTLYDYGSYPASSNHVN